jgi:hypothetical protein
MEQMVTGRPHNLRSDETRTEGVRVLSWELRQADGAHRDGFAAGSLLCVEVGVGLVGRGGDD